MIDFQPFSAQPLLGHSSQPTGKSQLARGDSGVMPRKTVESDVFEKQPQPPASVDKGMVVPTLIGTAVLSPILGALAGEGAWQGLASDEKTSISVSLKPSSPQQPNHSKSLPEAKNFDAEAFKRSVLAQQPKIMADIEALQLEAQQQVLANVYKLLHIEKVPDYVTKRTVDPIRHNTKSSIETSLMGTLYSEVYNIEKFITIASIQDLNPNDFSSIGAFYMKLLESLKAEMPLRQDSESSVLQNVIKNHLNELSHLKQYQAEDNISQIAQYETLLEQLEKESATKESIGEAFIEKIVKILEPYEKNEERIAQLLFVDQSERHSKNKEYYQHCLQKLEQVEKEFTVEQHGHFKALETREKRLYNPITSVGEVIVLTYGTPAPEIVFDYHSDGSFANQGVIPLDRKAQAVWDYLDRQNLLDIEAFSTLKTELEQIVNPQASTVASSFSDVNFEQEVFDRIQAGLKACKEKAKNSPSTSTTQTVETSVKKGVQTLKELGSWFRTSTEILHKTGGVALEKHATNSRWVAGGVALTTLLLGGSLAYFSTLKKPKNQSANPSNTN